MKALSDYIGNAEVFPILEKMDFYNHAGVSPLPRPSGQAFIDFVRQIETSAYVGSDWHAKIDQLRQSAGTMLNCTKQEIAFIKNTSEGLNIVAAGLDWKRGDRIVTTNVEYPANVYPWMEVARRYGVELVMVEESADGEGRRIASTERILEAAAHPRTRLVTLSHVEFASGQRHDLAAIGNFCRANGKLFCVDAIQSMGVIPIDVAEMKIDYLSADGHKWLLGPEAAGVFYCRKELLEKTRPLNVGWLNVVNAQDFTKYDYKLRPDSGRFESGSNNTPGLLSLKESLELLLELGVANVGQRIRELGDRLIAGIVPKGYTIASPRQGEQWSGILSFASPKHAAKDIVAKLKQEHKIELMVRHDRVRFAPHFYNTEEQIDRLINLLPGN
jgi:cysteine desulfurase / selenocysteine lyase